MQTNKRLCLKLRPNVAAAPCPPQLNLGARVLRTVPYARQRAVAVTRPVAMARARGLGTAAAEWHRPAALAAKMAKSGEAPVPSQVEPPGAMVAI